MKVWAQAFLFFAALGPACSGPQAHPCPRLELRVDGVCQKAAAPREIVSEEVRFPTRDPKLELDATITMPVWREDTLAPRALPGIVLIGGSGPTSRNDAVPGDAAGAYGGPVSTYVDLAEGLARRGFVVMRYDKRTCSDALPGKSCKTPVDIAVAANWSDLKADVVSAASYLASRPETHPSDIILAGHSQGGKFAMLVASDIPSVSAVINMAGPYRSMSDYALAQMRWQIDRLDPLSRMVIKSKIDEVETMIAEASAAFSNIETLSDEATIMGLRVKFWREMLADQARLSDITSAMTIPVFYLRGDDDPNIVAKDSEAYDAILNGRDNYLNRTYPGVAHNLNLRNADHVSPEIIDDIAAFLGGL